MGIASFSVTKANAGRGTGSPTLTSTTVVTSGAFTTSATAAANIEDGSGDITLSAGQVLRIHASEAMRVAFGGTAATASTGHYIPAAGTVDFECDVPGVVSAIDVA